MRYLLTWEPDNGIEQTLIIDATADLVDKILTGATEYPDGIIILESRLSESSDNHPWLYRAGRIRSITSDAGYQTDVRDGRITRDSRPASNIN